MARNISTVGTLIRDCIESFRDRNLDDGLLRYLVGTVYGMPGTLYASMAMGLMITAVAWAVSRDAIFLGFAVVHFVLGAARLLELHRFRTDCKPNSDRQTLLAHDRAFATYSIAYAFVLGITFFDLQSLADAAVAMPLAVGGAVGFSIAFAGRHPGRLRLLAFQVACVLGPMTIGFLTLPIGYGGYYAILFVGLAVSSIMMGYASQQRLIQHFQINETNRRMARADMLTGLLNRFAFTDVINEAVASAKASGARFALATVDLDRFKQVNDTLGHMAGDAVIVEAASALRGNARADDVIARVGGDEFAVLTFGGALTANGLAGLGARLVRALSQPIDIAGVLTPMSASVGLAIYPDHGETAELLIKASDIALYEAKRAGRGRFSIFTPAMQSQIDATQRLEVDMETALRNDQFEPWFQPIQNIETGAIVGFEALARWRHPDRGLIAPDVFIPAAEQSAAIVAIGDMILRKACLAAAGWDTRLTVAVNLSPGQFREPVLLVDSIKRILRETGLEPTRLFIEITESLMLEDTQQTREAIQQLADHGVRFSLDDFGVGYSSLSYIQVYPFSKIKIDRSFVARVDSDNVSTAIIASVCALASRVRMEIVAEGVETHLQQAALKSLGIRHAQGYLYGRPQPQALSATTIRLVS